MSSLLGEIGNTPLVSLSLGRPSLFYAKLEYMNPGGSVKDRLAKYLIEEAEKDGILKPGGIIIEASSGNFGIALAMIGAIKGYRVIITASERISEEKLKAIKAYGAEVILCPLTEFIDDPKSYHSKAKEIFKVTPGAYMPDQFYNSKNSEAYYKSLGPEIWKQTDGNVTHVFAAAGTGGHISGVGKYLKEQNTAIKIIAVDVDASFYSTGGHPKPYVMEGIGIDFISPVLDESTIDEFVTVSDSEGLGMLKIMASEYGILVGPSAGAVAYATKNYANKLQENDVAVMIFADSGRAYLSKNYY